MEKSILYMFGGEKYIKPHYNIKAESTSCHNLKGFTGIEVNGVRFANLGEMLRYMNEQKEQLTKVKQLFEDVYKIAMGDWNDAKWHDKVLREAGQLLKEE